MPKSIDARAVLDQISLCWIAIALASNSHSPSRPHRKLFLVHSRSRGRELPISNRNNNNNNNNMRSLLFLCSCFLVQSNVFLWFGGTAFADAFTGPAVAVGRATPSSSSSSMVLELKPTEKPVYDRAAQKWERGKDDDGEYPYGAVGSLLRFGPSPFVKRLTDPEEYEQSVLEYMAEAGVSRSEATGNMDFKLFNAADWAFAKMEEKRGRPKADYTKLDTKQAVLTVVWGLFVTPFLFYYFSLIFARI